MHRLIPFLQYENILILGYGREGKSTYRLIRRLFPNKKVTIYDAKHIDGSDLVDVVLLCGEDAPKKLDEFDLVIKSPGIVLTTDEVKSIRNLTSQTELFLRVFAKQTIGITGTKGKSTTSSLLYHVLNQTRKNVFLAGNIGIPCFDIVEDIHDDSIIVFEMSCHQLEYTSVSPHVAIFLNIFEEHLDHYGTLDAYVNAKRNILLHQDKEDVLLIHQSIRNLTQNSASQVITVGGTGSNVVIDDRDIVINNERITIEENDTLLLGKHNIVNIGFVYAVCKELFDVTERSFKASLRTFHGLPHRLELFASKDGVRYYDDSISTASETTIQALQSIDQVGVLILGGMDRGISYDKLADYISQNYRNHVILMPATSTRIYDLLKKRIHENQLFFIHHVRDLKEAVDLAKRLAKPGDAVVLSPAAASYGFFRDFEDRGNTFQQLVTVDTIE